VSGEGGEGGERKELTCACCPWWAERSAACFCKLFEPKEESSAGGGDDLHPEAAARQLRLAPRWLSRPIAFLYPLTFGVSEAIAHLMAKANTNMANQCNDNANCSSWLIPFTIGTNIAISILGALWLMRITYRRNEVTIALPIEYGAVTVFDFVSGLVFFSETDYMESWAVALAAAGIGVVVLGICVTQLEALPGFGRLPLCITSRFSHERLASERGKPATPAGGVAARGASARP